MVLQIGFAQYIAGAEAIPQSPFQHAMNVSIGVVSHWVWCLGQREHVTKKEKENKI